MTNYDFPMIDLHLHLDGSVLPETLIELAAERGVTLPGQTVEGYKEYIAVRANCGSVDKYLEMFEDPLSVLQDAPALTRVTRELVELLHSQGLAYAEIRFAPQLHTRSGLTQAQAVEAVLKGRQEGLDNCPGFEVGILCCMMCIGPETINWAANEETVEVTKAYLGQGVVGLDLAGAEDVVPLSVYAPLFHRANELEIPFTCHGGDSESAWNVAHAMDFGSRRMGHGHRVGEDEVILARAIDLGVTIEVCPTSNIQCLTQPSYAEHPAKQLLDKGLNVTINTDNMTFAGVCLADEYRHCLEDMGFTMDDLRKMSENSVRASFMPEELRARLLKQLGKE